jgi:hypothetical protein
MPTFELTDDESEMVRLILEGEVNTLMGEHSMDQVEIDARLMLRRIEAVMRAIDEGIPVEHEADTDIKAETIEYIQGIIRKMGGPV